MQTARHFRDRRKYPRVCMDLPLEYVAKHNSRARGGIVVDASEAGFLIYSTEDMPIGAHLKIAVLFPERFELANFVVFAEIIWKKVNTGERTETYLYGVKFVQILEEDYLKLKRLLTAKLK